MMVIVLAVLLLLLCIFLVFLILSQDVRGGGLAGALGGGTVQGAFGGRSAESIVKMTAYLAAVFFVIILVMRYFSVGAGEGGITTEETGGAAPTAPAPAEAAPTAPAE